MRYFVITAYNKASQTGLFTKLRKPRVTVWYSHHQWRSHGGGVNSLFVANVTSYLVTFIRILQNLYFIYPI